jgi:hypothetical protein
MIKEKRRGKRAGACRRSLAEVLLPGPVLHWPRLG